VDQQGFLNLNELEAWLEPPTRLVSLIWGQSEVGTVQPIQAIGELCRRHGVPIHVDAVQILGHRTICFDQLPVDLLSGTAHKLQGPRGVGLLLVAPDQPLLPLIGGGGQEGGLRAGSEPVALVAGFAAALQQAVGRLAASAGDDPIAPIRDQLLIDCLRLRGLRLSGPDPRQDAASRLPHHLSLLVSTGSGIPLNGRDLVRELNDLGIAASSGSACSSRGSGASPVLLALGYGQHEAMSGLRLSLGPWLGDQELRRVPTALSEAIRRVEWKASQ
jgi:cysteine desulfurase